MTRHILPASAKAIPLAASLCFTLLVGCGDEGDDVTNVTNEVTGMEKVSKYSELPECSEDYFGRIYYVSDAAQVFYCNEKEWVAFTNTPETINVISDSSRNPTMDMLDTSEAPITIVTYGNFIDGLGECNDKRNGEVSPKDSVYFICDEKIWRTAIPYEYDTYKWADSTDGAQRKGAVTGKPYIYDYDHWRAAIGVEKELGACVKGNEADVKKFNETYFICKQRAWNVASTIEYDTYGIPCMKDAAIESGNIHSHNKYVCDKGKFRYALPLEITANLGCTSYNDGLHWKIQNSNYICDWDSTLKGAARDTSESGIESFDVDRDTSGWSFDFGHLNIGTMIDPRDGETYRTIGIKSQVWMAQNLRYVSANSVCQYNELTDDSTYCKKYGRLYKWDAAKKACPEGWHLPDTTDWWVLRIAVKNIGADGLSESCQYGNCNIYGFTSLPTYYGYRDEWYSYIYEADGETIKDSVLNTQTAYTAWYYDQAEFFWSSVAGEVTYSSLEGGSWTVSAAYYVSMDDFETFWAKDADRTYAAFPVRCVKDSEE